MRSKTARPFIESRTVALLAYEGVSMFEFSVACEVFGSAESDTLGAAWYRFLVCSDTRSVRLDNGMVLQIPRRLASAQTADTVVVPPCEDPNSVSDAVLAAVRRAHARGARIVSLCTGAFVLARAGILDGRRAVTHWAECPELAAAYPSIVVDPKVLYVDGGDILTSAGSAASIDLCLHVVRLDYGATIARTLARQLVVQPHRGGGQAQFISSPIPEARDEETPFATILSWMTEHLEEPLSIAGLAAQSAMSERSFARHFAAHTGATPYQWLLQRRVETAQRLLETTDLTLDSVAARVGLGNATNLHKHFRRRFGTNPSAYRAAFNERHGVA